MAKSSRAYRSAKRSRELDRLRKQEEKRRRRQGKGGLPVEGEEPSAESVPAEGAEAEGAAADTDADDSGIE